MTRFYCLKDLAARLEMHPRTVRRWWIRLRVPPTIRGNAFHRWSEADARRFIAKLIRAKAAAERKARP